MCYNWPHLATSRSVTLLARQVLTSGLSRVITCHHVSSRSSGPHLGPFRRRFPVRPRAFRLAGRRPTRQPKSQARRRQRQRHGDGPSADRLRARRRHALRDALHVRRARGHAAPRSGGTVHRTPLTTSCFAHPRVDRYTVPPLRVCPSTSRLTPRHGLRAAGTRWRRRVVES